MKPKILIVEDESKYAFILEKYFMAQDFTVCLSFDGLDAVEKFKSFEPDIICLDIMLPVIDGWEVARRIRERNDTPIIMMSALSEEEDILKGYSLKIDDYITKPFRIPVLIAKARSILERRKSLIKSFLNDELVIKNVKIRRNTLECYVNEENVKLTKTDFKILECLMDSFNRNCTRQSLLKVVWEDKDVDERIIDSYIKRIRQVIKDGGLEIITVFGIGYRLEESKECNQ